MTGSFFFTRRDWHVVLVTTDITFDWAFVNPQTETKGKDSKSCFALLSLALFQTHPHHTQRLKFLQQSLYKDIAVLGVFKCEGRGRGWGKLLAGKDLPSSWHVLKVHSRSHLAQEKLLPMAVQTSFVAIAIGEKTFCTHLLSVSIKWALGRTTEQRFGQTEGPRFCPWHLQLKVLRWKANALLCSSLWVSLWDLGQNYPLQDHHK